MIHAVKHLAALGLELFLDAAVEWSPDLDAAVEAVRLASVGIYA